jgi:hypothetical protein
MDCAIRVISEVLKWCLGKELKPGVIAVLHTYGRDLKFNPHLDLLVTEGGFKRDGKWIPRGLFPYEMLRKAWQYQLLTSLKKSIENNAKNKKLIDSLFKRYPNGFYVYAKDTVKGKKRVACYIGRYIRHPAIANSRIESYDGKQVTFWWQDHKKIKHYRTMGVADFIGAVIGHIPARNFKTVRYYGVYERSGKSKFLKLLRCYRTMTKTKLNGLSELSPKRTVICPKCGWRMELVWYQKADPPLIEPKFGERITDWHEILARAS